MRRMIRRRKIALNPPGRRSDGFELAEDVRAALLTEGLLSHDAERNIDIVRAAVNLIESEGLAMADAVMLAGNRG